MFDQTRQNNTVYVPHMYLKSTNFNPDPASERLELYLSSLKRELNSALLKNRPIFTRAQHSLAQQALKFKANQDIVITDSDKNLGPVILPTKVYEDLVQSHLSDVNIYQQVSQDHLKIKCDASMSELDFILIRYLNPYSKRIYRKILEWLFHHTTQPHPVPKFRIIPKIHKKGDMKSRPISGATNWITTAPATLAAYLLQPALKEAEKRTVLRNSQALIQNLEGKRVPKNAILFSFDVVSLYTNMRFNEIYRILWEEAMDTHYYCLDSLGLQLAFWVLKNSFIQFKDKIYQQISGMAMGTNMAVEIANLFLFFGIDLSDVIQNCLESDIFLLWQRYIDDCVGIYNPDADQENDRGLAFYLEKLNNEIPGITFTMEQSETSLTVLDLEMFKVPCSDDPDYCTIQFRPFQKGLNKYLYLPALSSHSPALQRGFVKGELIRYIRNSSNRADFVTLRDLFRLRLRLRGYPDHWIDQVFRSVSYSDRRQHLQQRKEEDSSVLPFIIRGNSRQRRLQLPKILRTTHASDSLETDIKSTRLKPTLCLKSGQPLSRFLYRDLTPHPYIYSRSSRQHRSDSDSSASSTNSNRRPKKQQRRR